MILEIGCIEIAPENHEAFRTAITRAVDQELSASPGFIDFTLHQGIERPEAYQLHIRWETLEDHTIGFRESERFTAWREIIGGFFVAPPSVEHWSTD
jgi:heme-degrading monooxygenase HmoA